MTCADSFYVAHRDASGDIPLQFGFVNPVHA